MLIDKIFARLKMMYSRLDDSVKKDKLLYWLNIVLTTYKTTQDVHWCCNNLIPNIFKRPNFSSHIAEYWIITTSLALHYIHRLKSLMIFWNKIKLEDVTVVVVVAVAVFRC